MATQADIKGRGSVVSGWIFLFSNVPSQGLNFSAAWDRGYDMPSSTYQEV